MGRRERSSAQWHGHVQAWRSSDLSRAAYCAREGLSLSAFCYWIKKTTKVLPRAPAQPLTLIAGAVAWRERGDDCALTVRTAGGWQLSFAQCPSPQWLIELMGHGAP